MLIKLLSALINFGQFRTMDAPQLFKVYSAVKSTRFSLCIIQIALNLPEHFSSLCGNAVELI